VPHGAGSLALKLGFLAPPLAPCASETGSRGVGNAPGECRRDVADQ
jgi:hypothetical protein